MLVKNLAQTLQVCWPSVNSQFIQDTENIFTNNTFLHVTPDVLVPNVTSQIIIGPKYFFAENTITIISS